MVQIYTTLPIQCSFFFFCMSLDAVCFMGGQNLRKIALFLTFSTVISVLFQETLAVISQQFSFSMLNAGMYSCWLYWLCYSA